MIVNVWLIYKTGEDRVYTRTTEPDEAQKSAYRHNGFQIFRASVLLPVDNGTPSVCSTAFTEDEIKQVL